MKKQSINLNLRQFLIFWKLIIIQKKISLNYKTIKYKN